MRTEREMVGGPRRTTFAADQRRAATRRPPERARRHRGALALLAAVVMAGVVVAWMAGRDAVAEAAAQLPAAQRPAAQDAPAGRGTPPGTVAPAEREVPDGPSAGPRSSALAREPAGGPDATGTPAYVVIGAADTLWDLLLPLVPAGRPPADYVAEVVAANGLDPRALQPGTVVRLP